MARSIELMRWLDRSLLRLAAQSLSLVNRHRCLPVSPQRIGIIQPNAIGDTLIGSGVVRAIAEHYTDAKVLVFHGPNNAAAVQMIASRPEAVFCRFSRPGPALRLLRGARLDLVVDLTPWPNLTAILARLSAPCCVGFAPQDAARGRLFDIAVDHRGDRHELDNVAAMARLFSGHEDYRMDISIENCQVAGYLPLDRLVICHLSAGGSRAADKAWPLDYWVVFCRSLIEAGYVPAFTGVANDQIVIDQLRSRLGVSGETTISLCGKIPFAELGDLLRRACAVVSVDTSILHLASAVDAMVFGLHGPTRSWRWGARSTRAVGLDSPHPNAGYISYGIEEHPRAAEIMRALTPEIVLEAVYAIGGPVSHAHRITA